jgi:hypothetical protein
MMFTQHEREEAANHIEKRRQEAPGGDFDLLMELCLERNRLRKALENVAHFNANLDDKENGYPFCWCGEGVMQPEPGA